MQDETKLKDPKNFTRITFETFKEMASAQSLSVYEKIGFPDSYRKDQEKNIFQDIVQKLNLDQENLIILDIGCGCSDLVNFFISHSQEKNQELLLVDSAEMLELSPYHKSVKKIPGQFPHCADQLQNYINKVDAIIVYSVLQHIVLDMNPYNFIDKALELLKPGGVFMFGDIPNFSKRNRYFQSEKGLQNHKQYLDDNGLDMNTPVPQTDFTESHEKIDDGLLFGILHRYRNLGFETYLVPQRADLPMANRREDLLIVKN